jgi:hypothetical protein
MDEVEKMGATLSVEEGCGLVRHEGTLDGGPQHGRALGRATPCPRKAGGMVRFDGHKRVEDTFSVRKRVFGEYVSAESVNMTREMAMEA